MNRSNLKRVVRRLSKLKKEDIKTMYKLYGKTSYYLEYNEESKDNKLKLNKEIITIDLLNPDEKKTSSKNKKSISSLCVCMVSSKKPFLKIHLSISPK